MNQEIETIIIGGGQAGLSTSYHLKQRGLEHLVLEAAAQPAHAWRDDRWDSFNLLTPNWSFHLTQLHATQFRNTAALPPGAVLVMGEDADYIASVIAANGQRHSNP